MWASVSRISTGRTCSCGALAIERWNSEGNRLVAVTQYRYCALCCDSNQ